jgi:hypothetical protein
MSSPGSQRAEDRDPIRPGHWAIVDWMAGPAFRETVERHREGCGAKATIYFRPTDNALVRIALHPSAPRYLGFRTRSDDEGFAITPSSPPESAAEIEGRLALFETWLPDVKQARREVLGPCGARGQDSEEWHRRKGAEEGSAFVPGLVRQAEMRLRAESQLEWRDCASGVWRVSALIKVSNLNSRGPT